MNRFLRSLSLTALAICCVPASPRDLMSDTWVATDGLGRTMPVAAMDSAREEKPRTVGIFYITWHEEFLHSSPAGYRDVTDILEADPQARLTDATGLWGPPSNIGSYHWGEPETGYFLSGDRYVIRKDISMLADAGVDVLILDVTNAVCYWKEWEELFTALEEMKREGNPVPGICFWGYNGPVITRVQEIFERYYRPGKFRDLWFYWDGKPLLLCNMRPELDAGGGGARNPNPNYDPQAAADPGNPHYGDPDYTDEFYRDYTKDVKDFFTMRNMWWGYDRWGGKPYAGTEDNWCFGYEMNDPAVGAREPLKRAATHRGRVEQMAVTAGQHPVSVTGKCWRVGTGQPPLNNYDLVDSAYVPWLGKTVKHPEAYGIYFQDRWDEAVSVDPDFIYLNDWNEWTAGKYVSGRFPDGRPDGPTTFLGRNENTFYFVDQYNAEFNRTIQPAKGVCSDNYYMQMAQNIRRYKGSRPVPQHSGIRRMAVDGRFNDWNEVASYYFDTRGDIWYRDHNGYAGHHYTDTTGRNDIVELKVAVGKRDIYFYALTDSALTPYSDPNWMLLLIDSDNDSSTGWNGYDFIVNRHIADSRKTTLMRYDEAKASWVKVADLPYAVAGCELELSIPRKLLGLQADSIVFDFKWADNPQSLDDVRALYMSGDTAPNRRFNYRYIWNRKTASE